MISMSRLASLLLLLLCLVAPGLAQNPEIKIGTGAISGKVTIEGKPAPGAIVLYYKDDERWEPNRPASKVTTDASGVYHIEKLIAARYLITVSAPGYYNPKKRNEWDDGGTTVNLADGEQIGSIDFALTRGSVVTGRLFDERGRGVIEERVVLMKKGKDGKSQQINCSEQTDDRGVYRCYGLEPGQYMVGAGSDPKEGNVNFGRGNFHTRTWYPGVADEQKAKIIEVKVEAETDGIDIKLTRKKKGFKALGKMIDANTGKPIPNMAVAVSTMPEEGSNNSIAFGGDSMSGPDGDFKIEGLAPGKYQAIPQANFGGASEYFGDPLKFEITDADVTNLELKLEKGATITGTAILEDGVNPEVQKKFALNNVFAYSRDPNAKEGDWFSSSQSYSSIGVAGVVNFKGLRTGKVKFQLTGKEANGFFITRVEQNGVPLQEGLEVKAGEQVSGIRIIVAYGSAKIRGEIKVQGGTLTEDVGLRIKAKPADKNSEDIWGAVDTRGKYILEGLSAGSYELIVDTYANRPPYNTPSITFQTNSKTVQVNKGQDTTIDISVTIGSKNTKEEKQ